MFCLYFSPSVPPVQVQQKLTDLRVEERSVTAQLSWKRALEDNSPILVNGSAGPTAELHHGDLFLVEDHPFYELKEDEDEEEEDEEEEVSPARSHPMKEHCEEPRKMEEEEKADEGNEKTEGERPPTPEEKKAKQDALDDLYSSLASGDLYNSLGTISKAQDNNIIIMVGNPAELLILHETEPQRDPLAHV